MRKTNNLKATVEAYNDGSMSKEDFFRHLMYAISVIADKHDIKDKDDIIQDICIKVLEKVDRGSSLDASFFAWQVETEILRFIEASNKKPCEATLETVDSQMACAINIESIAGTMFIEEAMLHLKPRHQLVLKKFAEGYTYAEIGAEIGVNGERVRQILNQGLRKMRQVAYLSDVKF